MKEVKRIALEVAKNLPRESLQDKKTVSERIQLLADENEAFSNRVFEIGLKQIVKKCREL